MGRGNYQQTPPSVATGIELVTLMINGVPRLRGWAPTRDATDKLLAGLKAQANRRDANDLLYSFESPEDFDAEPALSQIKTKVFAVNFADDEFYRDSLQTLQHDMSKVRDGRFIVRPATAGSDGHLSMAHPSLWADQVRAFVAWLDGN